jgi:colanic acid/amylovoran biosynthesis glycosyltransferase
MTEAEQTARQPLRIALVLDQFPELSETFVAAEVRALAAAGHELRVESLARPQNPSPDPPDGVNVAYAEDDSLRRRLSALAWLVSRSPAGCLRDLLSRRRWRREEAVRSLAVLAPVARRIAVARDQHLHVHFAGGASLAALRLGRLLGLPYSVTTHAYDIYREPRNLREKLERAAFAAGVCDYTVAELRRRVSPSRARILKIVMGVDGGVFRRRRPPPEDGTVVAVARLVEKKGLSHLVDAAELLRGNGAFGRLLIAGAGPLQARLEAQIRELELEDAVQLLGPRSPSEIPSLLERADLLAMPCVVARDGDRDALPVVVPEALAMELPVVGSDEVGLPEVVHAEWGRLVPPGDPPALAEAIAELLALPTATRMEMGRAAREWVLENRDIHREAHRLAGLIAEAVAAGPR